MGYTWEVTIWGQPHLPHSDAWRDITVYSGESLVQAVIAFWKHRNKSGCVSINYRGAPHE